MLRMAQRRFSSALGTQIYIIILSKVLGLNVSLRSRDV